MIARFVAFVRRDFRIARTYRAAFVGQIAGTLVFLATFALVAPVVRDDFASRFGSSYLAFAAVGIAISGALLAALDSFSGSVREAQLDGTLEAVFLAPVPHTQLVALLGAWPLAVGFLGAGLTLGVAAAAAGGFHVAVVSLLVTAVLSVGAFGALGLLAAAVVVVAKRGNPVAGALGLAGSVAAGAYVPVETFPRWLQAVAAVNPMTYALDAWRGSLLEAAGLGDLAGPLLVLGAIAAVGLPVAWTVLRRSLDLARTDGTLCVY